MNMLIQLATSITSKIEVRDVPHSGLPHRMRARYGARLRSFQKEALRVITENSSE